MAQSLSQVGLMSATGLPLKDTAGLVLGVLVVASSQEKSADAATTARLRSFASVLARLLEADSWGDQAQRRLDEKRFLLDLAGTMSNLGGWTLNSLDMLVRFSSGAGHMRQFKDGDAIPYEKSVSQYTSESQQRARAAINACLSQGEPFDIELELDPEGSSRRSGWLRQMGQATRNETGAIVGARGAVQDITEQRHIRDEADRLSRRLVSTFESMNEAFFMLDRSWNFTYVNREFERLLQRSRDDVLGKYCWGEFTDALGTPFQLQYIRALETNSPVEFTEFYAPVGRWLEVRAYPSEEGLAVYFRDVTQRRQQEAERKSLETQLRQAQKMESLGTLAGGIAHDFNNSLGAVLGNVSMALEELPLSHPSRVHLDRVNRASQRARDLVEQILTFSRRNVLEVESQALAPVIDETVELLRSTLPARVRMQTQLSTEDLYVHVQGTQVQQVLMNLCTNAWHALHGSTGQITVGSAKVVLTGDEGIRLGALPAGAYAHLWVSDNGTGMDAGTRARLFEPFFTTKPMGEGTGLGLPVVHGTVMAHNGAIAVESFPDKGSTFHIYLPLAPPTQGGTGEAAPVEMPTPGSGQRVMYIDDDEVMLLTVERVLQRAGYRAHTFQSAFAALEALTTRPDEFDMVITDFNMPELSGLEVTEAIRRMLPNLPVIISSGYITDELRVRGSELGVGGLLRKQNTFEELGPMVADVFARQAV